jgi:hypothetical protein
MPRRSRISVAEVPVHIIQRGHNRSACFYCDEDRALYLAHLRELATNSVGASRGASPAGQRNPRTGARTRSRHLEQGSPIRLAAMTIEKLSEKLSGPSPISQSTFYPPRSLCNLGDFV